MVLVGRIGATYGVKGWTRIVSSTQPRSGILDLSPWLVQTGKGWTEMALEAGREHGRHLVVKLKGISDRDTAATLAGAEVAVHREVLPVPDAGEYYWCDLVGLTVHDSNGLALGTVQKLFETGSNDVLVVGEGGHEHLIPFIIDDVIVAVDLTTGTIKVDWDVDY